MKPLLPIVVTILALTANALPENIEDVKELPQNKEPVVEAEESDPQARVERCTTCSPKLGLKSPKDVLAALQQLPGAEIHTQQSFESCTSEKGCAGLKVKDGKVIQRFGNDDAFRAAAAQDTGNEFTFHAAGSLGNILEGGLAGEGGPFWWMNQNSPFKGAGAAGGGNFEKFEKSSSSSFSTTGAGGAGAGFDINANPFLNGDFSKQFTGAGFAAGAAAAEKPVGFQSSSFESSSFSTSSKGGEVDLSKNQFLNGGKAGAGGFTAQGGVGFGANNAGAGQFGQTGFGAQNSYSQSQFNKFGANGYAGSSPSPFTASSAGSNVNLIQNSQKANEFDFESQQSQTNIDEAFQSTGNVNAHEHSGGDLQQTCSGQGYVCVPKSQCNNGVVNTNGANVLAANTQKQYCNVRTEICCRIEVSSLAGAGSLQGSLGVGSAQFSGSGSQGSGLFVSNANAQGFQGQSTTGFNAAGQSGQSGSGFNAAGQSGSGFNAAGQSGQSGFNAAGQSTSFNAAGQSTFNQQGQTGFNGQSGFNQAGQAGQTGQTTGFGASSSSFNSNKAFGQGFGGQASFGADANRGGVIESSSTSFESRSKYGGVGGSTVAPVNKYGSGFNNEVFKSTSQSNFIETDSFSAGSETAGVYRPGQTGLKPGIPYLPPVDSSTAASNTVSSTAFVTTPRPFTTPRPITPRPRPTTSAPGYLPPFQGESSNTKETRLPNPNYNEGSIILDETRTTFRPQTQPAPNDIPSGCAAALKCTPIEFCTADGVISNTSVVLTRDQDAYRVPLTDCKDLSSGRVGKCCRDPLYTDPWPTNQLGKWVPGVFGGNDGQYVPDSRGSSNNPRPSQVTARPPISPITGSVILNNFITPKPTIPSQGPNQITPGFPSVTPSSYNKGQFEVRGQGSYSQNGQGQFGVGGVGQTSQGGQFGQGSQFTQTTSSSFGQTTRGQGQIVGQGQGQAVSQGVGQAVTQGQGAFGQGGRGQYEIQGQAGQNQYTQTQSFAQGQGQTVTQGQGLGITRGQGQLVSQGVGQSVTQGVGQSVSQGQGIGVIRGSGQSVTGGFGIQGQGQSVSQGAGFGISQGQGIGVTRGQGQYVTQGQGQTVTQGQGIGVTRGQGQIGISGSGQRVSQGQGQIGITGSGQRVSQGAGFGVTSGQGVDVTRSQGQFGTQGQGQIGITGSGQRVSQGVGFGVTTGQGIDVTRGQSQIGVTGSGQRVSQGAGFGVTTGQGQFGTQGQGQLVTQGQRQGGGFGIGFGLTQGQGESVSQGVGFGVTQGQGFGVTQGQGQGVRQGGGFEISAGQGTGIGQGIGFGVNQGLGFGVIRGQGQALIQGQGQKLTQEVGTGEIRGQGFKVTQGQGFGVENEYSESVQRVFLTAYNGGGGQCGLLNPQKPYGNRNDLEVDFAEIPWQAMVLLQTNRSLLCGGVITRPDVVVTSAACVDGLDARNVLIKGGEYKLGIDDEPLPFQIVQVKTIVRHPFYRRGSLKYDAAILVLAEDLRFAKNIYPICLPGPRDTLDAFYNGAGECIVTGWGKTVLQAHIKGAIMNGLNVSLINPGECEAKLQQDYPHLLDQYDEESCVCGQPTNPLNNMCKVDIGSALACSTGDGRFVFRGIYSWDSGCQVGNQIAGFYKFDLEWYEWAIGLIESVKYAKYGVGSKIKQSFSSELNSGVGIKGIKGVGIGGIKGVGITGIKGVGVNRGESQFGQFSQFGTSGQFGSTGLTGTTQFGSAGLKGTTQFGSAVTGSTPSGFGANFGANGASFSQEIKGPLTNSFSATYTEKKLFQTEPKFVTYTTKPEIVTFTTKPEYFTYTTKPKLVTYTTKPEIVTYTTKPEIVTFTTKPEIVTYTTKPKIVTYTTKPQIIRYETSGSGTNPQYVAPGVTFNPSFQQLVGHKHNGQCKCLENGRK